MPAFAQSTRYATSLSPTSLNEIGDHRSMAPTVTSAPNTIHPETVRSPFQLLGGWLVFIIVLDGSFLGAATAIHHPRWASGVLTIAAVVNVPALLLLIFLLQTRFRP